MGHPATMKHTINLAAAKKELSINRKVLFRNRIENR
jgi:hypothetical protein